MSLDHRGELLPHEYAGYLLRWASLQRIPLDQSFYVDRVETACYLLGLGRRYVPGLLREGGCIRSHAHALLCR